MKCHLFRLSLVLATVGLLSLAIPAPAQDATKPIRLTGTHKTAEDLGGFPSTPTLRFTIYGEGTIGRFVQIATVHFLWVGGEPAFAGPGTYLFEESSVIYVLGEDGGPTGDVIYLEAHGADGPGILGANGGFRITGGEGVYEGACGNGGVQDVYPGTYIGVIRK